MTVLDEWFLTCPADLVRSVSGIAAAREMPLEGAVFSVYTRNRHVVHCEAFTVGTSMADWAAYLVAEAIELSVSLVGPDVLAPHAVTYVVFGHRPSVQTDVLLLRPHVLDVLVAYDGRFWSLTCADPSCCPPGGTEL